MNLYEHKTQQLAPKHIFYKRIYYNLFWVSVVLGIGLLIGILGYHFIAHINWIDSIHNASMILSGMGPVAQIDNVAGKLFSSGYAIFSGVVFIANAGLLLTPLLHRLMHKLHMQEK